MKKRKIIMLISCIVLAGLLCIPEVRALATDPKLSEPIDICESKSVMKVLYMVKVAFSIIKVVIPLILVFTITLDAYPLINDPSSFKKVFPIIRKRLIAAFLVFFVPTIITVIMDAMGDDNRVSTCWNHADPAYYETLKN